MEPDGHAVYITARPHIHTRWSYLPILVTLTKGKSFSSFHFLNESWNSCLKKKNPFLTKTSQMSLQYQNCHIFLCLWGYLFPSIKEHPPPTPTQPHVHIVLYFWNHSSSGLYYQIFSAEHAFLLSFGLIMELDIFAALWNWTDFIPLTVPKHAAS